MISSLKVGPWYIEVNMDTAGIVWPNFSSLQCFWPGLQARLVMRPHPPRATETQQILVIRNQAELAPWGRFLARSVSSTVPE